MLQRFKAGRNSLYIRFLFGLNHQNSYLGCILPLKRFLNTLTELRIIDKRIFEPLFCLFPPTEDYLAFAIETKAAIICFEGVEIIAGHFHGSNNSFLQILQLRSRKPVFVGNTIKLSIVDSVPLRSFLDSIFLNGGRQRNDCTA